LEAADEYGDAGRRRPYEGMNILDAVFCGHTHIAEAVRMPDSGPMYYNSGCWTGNDAPTFVTISLDGSVTMQKYGG